MMRWIRALAGTIALAAVIALGTGAAPAAERPAHAQKVPRAPKGFFGVHVRGLAGGEFARMRDARVGIVRTGFNFSTLHPGPLTDNWSVFDNYVAETARNGMDLLPVVYGIPSWLPARLGIMDPTAQPAWQGYLTDLVDRYGPDGEFWQDHPEITPHPIRYWQLWNEPNSFANWVDPDGREFGRFLVRSASVIHAADPEASVVSGGIVSKPLNPDVQDGAPFLGDLFGVKAARRAVDIVAVHPYAKNARATRKAVQETRETLDRAGLNKTPIWVTEIGWGSTTPGGSSARAARAGGLSRAERRWYLTPAKQRENLRRTFEMTLKQRRKLGIGRVIWYQWQDGPDSDCRWCETAGLLNQSGVAKPLLSVFTSLARF
jgi:hypothetical protein